MWGNKAKVYAVPTDGGCETWYVVGTPMSVLQCDMDPHKRHRERRQRARERYAYVYDDDLEPRNHNRTVYVDVDRLPDTYDWPEDWDELAAMFEAAAFVL